MVVHREYGLRAADGSQTMLEILTNSLLVGKLNNVLSMPIMAGANPDQKIVWISGYKGLSQKVSGSNGREDDEVLVSLTNSLLTFKAPGLSQDAVIELANTIKIAEIAKLVQ